MHCLVLWLAVAAPPDDGPEKFARDMAELAKAHKLKRPASYESKHFLVLSNADPLFTKYRLSNCETMYKAFLKHFRKRGFELTEPETKFHACVFDKQEGFEAALGVRPGDAVTGVYMPATNRLVVYDFARNRAFLDGARRFEDATKGEGDVERQRRAIAFERWAADVKSDVNIGTLMHEVAHQMSYNTGLLKRGGDVPAWLNEGLATYCEPTEAGAWQGVGADNPMRRKALAGALAKGVPFLKARQLLGDDWYRKPRSTEDVLLGYSQSWGLFKMLVEHRPKGLKAYLGIIRERRSPDHRAADFAEAFGDLKKLETKYRAFLKAEAERRPDGRGPAQMEPARGEAYHA